MKHNGVDGASHDGRRESCAACIAMVDDGFYPPGNDEDVYRFTGYCANCGHAEAHHRDGALPKVGVCEQYTPIPISEWGTTDTHEDAVKQDVLQVDWVNPPHYRRGPKLKIADGVWKMVECIDVVRAIPDYRLANAIRYIWRVAFGGKWNDREDIEKAVWYLNDFLDNPIEPER